MVGGYGSEPQSFAIDMPVRAFLSYASADRDRVTDIVAVLERAGLSVWRDDRAIRGGSSYGRDIVQGIRSSDVMIVCCSRASMTSRNVAQEIRLAWRYAVPYLPLLIEPSEVPEQLQYWLEGWQWIAVGARKPDDWLPAVMRALEVLCVPALPGATGAGTRLGTLDTLWRSAAHTERIWTCHAADSAARDLGAESDEPVRRFALGARVAIVIDVELEGHLLFLDRGTSGKIYCLCPSPYAPETRMKPGLNRLPQPGSNATGFLVSGSPGREQLLAVLTPSPLQLSWKEPGARTGARLFSGADEEALLTELRNLPHDGWQALSTAFLITP